MLYKTLRAAVYGIDANIIQFEVDCSGIQCDQTTSIPSACPMRQYARAGTASAPR
jgi:hypothetical protein